MADKLIGHLPGIPSDIFTSDQPEVRRLQVDVSQTGFWAGREFRAFKELTVGATPFVVKIVVPNTIKGIIVHYLALSCYQGGIQFRAWRNGTEGGVFTAETVFPNNLIPDVAGYVGQVTISSGGTLTAPSIQSDSVVAFANETGKSNTTTATSITGERGLSPGTYYLEFSRVPGVTVDSLGVFQAIYEERRIKDPWVFVP